MLLLTLLPDCVFMYAIQSLLSMKDLLVLACTCKRMDKCTARAIKEKVERDARLLPFAEALMERVNVHTGLSIPFSIDHFRRIRKAIVYNGCDAWFGCVVTIFDGKLTVVGGPSCRFSVDSRYPMSSSAACCLTIDSIEAGEATTFMGEARYNIDQSYKFPNGTSFDAILDFFPPKADYFLDARHYAQQESARVAQEMLIRMKRTLQSMDDLDEAEAGGTETRDDDCILLGDDDCLIVEDARTKSKDDDCVLLGDDDCHIVEDAQFL